MYLKKIVLLVILFISSATFADVIIFNKNRIYDMNVTYNFCNYEYDNHSFTCTSQESVKVKHEDKNKNEGSWVIKYPPASSRQFINIISVEQVDEAGRIIAQANYSFNEEESSCGMSTFSAFSDNKKYKINGVFLLANHGEFPIITCQSLTSSIEKLN